MIRTLIDCFDSAYNGDYGFFWRVVAFWLVFYCVIAHLRTAWRLSQLEEKIRRL